MSCSLSSSGSFARIPSRSCICSRMSSGRSFSLFLIFPFGMYCLSAARMMLVRSLFPIMGFWGLSVLRRASSMYSVKFGQSAFL